MIPLPPFAMKLIGGGVIALLIVATIFGLIRSRNHWKDTATLRQQQITATCEATRQAAGNQNMACGDMIVQIDALGDGLRATTAALNRQNAAVDALATRSKQQQDSARKASKRVQERAGEATGVSARLIASSRSSGGRTGFCEPSETIKEVWK